MYGRYYSYNDMPQVVRDKPSEKKNENPPEKGKSAMGFATDDIILWIVILAILLDDGNDNILLLALAAIFLSGNL